MTEWNNERSQALERALNQLLYPQLIKELKGRLLEEAKDTIVKVGLNLSITNDLCFINNSHIIKSLCFINSNRQIKYK